MLQKFGGISRYFENLLIGFSENTSLGVDPYVYNFREKKIFRFDNLNSLKELYCRNNPFAFLDHSFSSKESLHLNSNLIDTIHFTYYLRNMKLFDLPKSMHTVSTIHDFIPAENLSKCMAQRIIYDKNFYLEKSNKVIFVSEETGSHAKKLGLRKDGSIIPLGGDHLSKLNLSEIGETNNYGKYILYVGKRHGYKNFNDLLMAYVNSDIPKTFSEKVFLLRGSDHLLSKIYSKAFVTVSTSLNEGFSLVPLEVSGFGGISICSNIEIHNKYIKNFALGYEVSNYKSLISKIESLINSSSLRNSLLKRSLKFGLEYSWDNICRQTSLTYQN
jgi:glycosyltransferase involved in cell wall biosynthesis